jgi:2-C-methyl-D-erythritol 2,4-cyclodiphosphate synthase
MDALLGAAALRDIGFHFPDTDPAYKGADSRQLLRQVGKKIAEAGYKVGNLDVTVIAQKPKLKDYIPQMAANIAEDLQISVNQVNVKATTEEGLGFTGSGEGIACHCVSLLETL